MRQRPESLSRFPVKIVTAPFVTATLFAVNVTAQPLSHICPTESSELWANPGRIWACLAAIGKEGKSKVEGCVDAMMAPFGRRTSNGDCASNFSCNDHWISRNVQFNLVPRGKLSFIEVMGYSLNNSNVPTWSKKFASPIITSHDIALGGCILVSRSFLGTGGACVR
jgi:hypothetical protein